MRGSRFLVVILVLSLLRASLLSAADVGVRPVVWPPAPEPPRLAFVRSFSGAADLGIARGLLDRVRDLIFGEAETRLVRPMAVVASRGVIYVADPGVRGVHRFDTVRGSYGVVRAADGSPLPSPVGLALGAAGEVYVTDSARAEVLVIAPEGRSALPLKLGVRPAQPTGIAYDSRRRQLIVADTAAHRLLVFAADGTHLSTIGRRGTAGGEFNFPTHLWVESDGGLLVSDSLNFRVQSFDAEGRFVASFGRQGDGIGDAPRQKGIASDRHGHIYVADAVLDALQIFDRSGRLLLALGGRGSETGEFRLPAGVFIESGDAELIYVADSANRRIQVLRYVGGAS
jgi:DNA-binding beta-propeller fold protein YncE